MMVDQQRISVIIPTYNDADYLNQAIESVINQTTNVDIEVVIVDSSDDEQVKDIASYYDSKVTYSWIEPSNVAAARNHGIDLSIGKIIGFCDADDYWHSTKLAKQLPLINKGCDIVYADEYLIDDSMVVRKPSPTIDNPSKHHVKYFREGGIGSRSVLVRKKVLENEQFDERFIVREDPHLWTRLFAKYTPGRVDEPLSYKRRRSDSLTSDRDLAFEMQMMEIKDLVNKFPELEPYGDEREKKAKIQYAKSLISDEDRPNCARTILIDVLQDGYYSPKIMILYIISLFPSHNQEILRYIQKVYWKGLR